MAAEQRFRNRVKELRFVRAGELLAHPRNWRRHPDAQREALEHILGRVGWAGALLAREDGGELVLIDGHLRAGIDSAERVPVLVTDLTEDEAETMLLATDPLAAMAEADAGLLGALMADADPEALGPLEPTLSRMLLQAEDFVPERLEPEPTRCPNCGHEWRP
jgi:hypothetical protein